MAFFAPIVAGMAAVGGGSAVAGTLLAATAATGIMAAKSAHDAGQIAQAEAKLQGRAAGDAARAREIERKRALISSLASQHASAGANGVAMQGSNVAIANRDIKNNRQDLLYDTANTKTQQRVLRARGSNAARQGDINAISSLVDTGVGVYQARG